MRIQTVRHREPVTQAVQLTIFNLNEAAAWCNGAVKGIALPVEDRVVDFYASDGEHRVQIGDWIVRRADGRFQRYEQEEFEGEFEKVG